MRNAIKTILTILFCIVLISISLKAFAQDEVKNSSDKSILQTNAPKKLTHNFEIDRVFSKQNFSYNTPNANSILHFSDMNANGVNASYKISINQNKTFGVNTSYSNVTDGFGSDDDITNYNSKSSSMAAFSVHKIKGSMLDANIFAKFNINTYYQYGFGYSFKRYKFQMYDMNQLYVDSNGVSISSVSNATNFQFTDAQMQTIYTSLDVNPNENISFYLQLHMGQYRAKNDWQAYQWTLNSKSNFSSMLNPQNGYGVVFGFNGKIKTSQIFSITYFAKYDNFTFKNLVENNLGYGGDYVLPSNYPSKVIFSRMMMGVGLEF